MNKFKEYIKVALAFIISIGLLFLVVTAIVKVAEEGDKERFNNGICINCGEKLEPFDVDKYGNVVWLCDDCGYNCVH